MLRKFFAVVCVAFITVSTPLRADDIDKALFDLSIMLMEQSIRTQQQYVRTQQQYVRTQYQEIRTQKQWIHAAEMWVQMTAENTVDTEARIIRVRNGLQSLEEWIDIQKQDIRKVQGVIVENENSLNNIKLGLVHITYDVISVLVTEIVTFENRIRVQETTISNTEQAIMQMEESIVDMNGKIDKL